MLGLAENDRIEAFHEKHDSDASLINSGFMICGPAIFDYLTDDQCVLEKEPLDRLASNGERMAYRHEGFWKCMDMQREKQ